MVVRLVAAAQCILIPAGQRGNSQAADMIPCTASYAVLLRHTLGFTHHIRPTHDGPALSAGFSCIRSSGELPDDPIRVLSALSLAGALISRVSANDAPPDRTPCRHCTHTRCDCALRLNASLTVVQIAAGPLRACRAVSHVVACARHLSNAPAYLPHLTCPCFKHHRCNAHVQVSWLAFHAPAAWQSRQVSVVMNRLR